MHIRWPEKDWVRAHQRLVFNVCLAGFAAGLYVAYRDTLGMDGLIRHKAALEAFSAAYPVVVVLILWLVQVVFTLLYLPGGAVLPVAAGALFGIWAGTAITVVGATLAGLASYLAGRYWLADSSPACPRVQQLVRRIRDDATASILFMRTIPVAPFWLVSYVAAYIRMPLPRYLGATLVGVIPQAWLYVSLGVALDGAGSLHQVGWLVLGLVVLAVAGMWLHRRHLAAPHPEKSA